LPLAPTGPDPMSKPPRAADPHSPLQALSAVQAQAVDAIARFEIPPRPALLMALQREIRHEQPQVKRVAQLISRDVAMAGKLLQAANSAFFSLPRKVATVDDALVMIGMQHCGAMMTSLITRNLMAQGRTMMARFWDVSEKRAKSMAFLASELRTGTPDRAHTFGLFCDIGIPLMKAHFTDYLETLALANSRSGNGFTDIERSRHGIDHAVVGAVLAEQWGMDEVVVMAIRLHHDYDVLYQESVPAEVRALLAMNLQTERVIQAFRGDAVSLEWVAGGAAATEALDLDAARVEALCAEMKRRF
jgi:HD-like signal output (HDOD) protein